MKRYIKTLSFLSAGALLAASCSGALDPMRSGDYTEENYQDYPTIIRGFVDRAFTLLPTAYTGNEFIYLDCATDNAVATSSSNSCRRYALGTIQPSDDPFSSWWSRDYNGIAYVNMFLKDDLGISTQYLLDHEQDSLLRRNYQGDAYALRAWFGYDLLRKFGGRSKGGELLGYPIVGVDFDRSNATVGDYPRASFDDCVKSILADCDSAMVYLPYANRSWYAENSTVQGSARWARFDQVSVTALRSLVYLLWASDAFNPSGDVSRWEKAAQYAAEAMRFKLEDDGAHGFSPYNAFYWTDPNSREIFWCSRYSSKSSAIEETVYPSGFMGNGAIGPTQELADAFPMANGYPITDIRSGYNPAKPFEGRDPRFYSTLFYHGSDVLRSNRTGNVMYTFDVSETGADRPGLPGNTLTGYYVKKFVCLDWNGFDLTQQSAPHAVFFIGWRDVCLAFAEAANRAYGPLGNSLGYSAKEALGYLRARTTSDGKTGLGRTSDPYLDECAAGSREDFEKLVRNERRIETCFEGERLYDLVRWAVPMNERNVQVHAFNVSAEGKYSTSAVYTINHVSPYIMVPYHETVRSNAIEQNEGWENWK